MWRIIISANAGGTYYTDIVELQKTKKGYLDLQYNIIFPQHGIYAYDEKRCVEIDYVPHDYNKIYFMVFLTKEEAEWATIGFRCGVIAEQSRSAAWVLRN